MIRNGFHVYSVKYAFNQLLAAPAAKAFDWCTDYQPNDFNLMKEKGKRTIRKLTEDLILLTETSPKKNRSVIKTKLVRLDRAGLSYTNTHILGPNRHSQFLYKIVPEGRARSRLYFRGLLICYSRKPLSKCQLLKIGRDERRMDSTIWHHLAAELRKEAAKR